MLGLWNIARKYGLLLKIQEGYSWPQLPFTETNYVKNTTKCWAIPLSFPTHLANGADVLAFTRSAPWLENTAASVCSPAVTLKTAIHHTTCRGPLQSNFWWYINYTWLCCVVRDDCWYITLLRNESAWFRVFIKYTICVLFSFRVCVCVRKGK